MPCMIMIAAVHPHEVNMSFSDHSMFDEVLIRDELTLALASLVESGALPSSSPHFVVPAEGRITSAFGMRRDPFHRRCRFHTGIDIANVRMSKIKASADGVVRSAGRRGAHGRSVTIDHGNGFSTTYSHLTRLFVKRGHVVRAGDTIGGMGKTGRATGSHLHFEIRKNGLPVDPLSHLMISMVQLASK